MGLSLSNSAKPKNSFAAIHPNTGLHKYHGLAAWLYAWSSSIEKISMHKPSVLNASGYFEVSNCNHDIIIKSEIRESEVEIDRTDSDTVRLKEQISEYNGKEYPGVDEYTKCVYKYQLNYDESKGRLEKTLISKCNSRLPLEIYNKSMMPK